MEHWNKAMAAITKVGEVISRTAQSAQELLRDQELRNKGIQTVITGAQTRLQGIQNGIAQRAGRLGERLLDNRRQLLALLQNLEERLNASQRAWQLQVRRRDRVDVQFGRQVIADAPQEIRARLWYVLLENPHLAAPLKCQHPGPENSRLLDIDAEVDDLTPPAGTADSSTRARGSVTSAAAGGEGASGGDGSLAAGRTLSTSSSSSRLAAAVAAAAMVFGRNSSGAVPGSFTNSPSSTSIGVASRRERAGGLQQPGTAGVGPQSAAQDASQRQARPQQPQGQQQPQTGADSPASSSMATPVASRTSRAGAATEYVDAGHFDGWELVSGVLEGPDAMGFQGVGSGTGGVQQPEAVRIIMERLEALGPQPMDESGSDAVLVAQQAVLEAMLQVPWEQGGGLPHDYPPDCRFALLNEMTAGQEEVDDSILRDIHRTFPEHPYFGMESGQRALFRVLKAYSLHDLEVAYCQGMAFMAGVLLMYVPEEIAFRLFCRLMDTEGPNLRRLYLPGLEPLKVELATFELLLTWRLPDLAAHLSEYGLPPVLYVSQWLMTLFATPFPPAFCARVIDILLQDGHDRLLLRCSFAVMEALDADLLARHDFEALITYLKMEPVTWGLTRQRAIMDRALNSPITDAEIEVARDAVVNRQYMAAAAAAAAAGASTSAHGAAGSGAAAKAGSMGHDHTAGGATVSPMEQRQLSLEEEVEAALTVAAAAITASASGRLDEAAAAEAEASGRPLCGFFAGEAAADGGEGPSHRCRTGGDVTAVGSHGGGGAADAGSGAVVRGVKDGAQRGTAQHREGCHGGTGSQQSLQAAAGGEADEAGLHPGTSTAVGVEAGSSVRHSCGGGDAAAYGMSASLLHELNLDTGGGGGGVGGGASSAATTAAKVPELEYGEYGDMLLDVGLVLPEVGTALHATGGAADLLDGITCGLGHLGLGAIGSEGSAPSCATTTGGGHYQAQADGVAAAGLAGLGMGQQVAPPGLQHQPGADLLMD